MAADRARGLERLRVPGPRVLLAGIVIARQAKKAKAAGGQMIDVDIPAANAASVVFDAAIVPSASGAADPLAGLFIMEAYGHAKTIGAIGSGAKVLESAGVNAGGDGSARMQPGVITGGDVSAVAKAFMKAMLKHRHFDRDVEANKGAMKPKKKA